MREFAGKLVVRKGHLYTGFLGVESTVVLGNLFSGMSENQVDRQGADHFGFGIESRGCASIFQEIPIPNRPMQGGDEGGDRLGRPPGPSERGESVVETVEVVVGGQKLDLLARDRIRRARFRPRSTLARGHVSTDRGG